MKRTYLLLIITAILFSARELAAQTPKAPVTDEAGKNRITAEDVLTIRELYDVKLEPHGKQIAFVVNEPNDPKAPREPRASNIWIVSTDGREAAKPVIPGLKNAYSPSWSPDGRTLAFLSDRADPQAEAESSTQIYLWNGEGKALRLTNVPGGVDQYEWSPDGKVIAFLARDQATAEEQERRSLGDDPIVQPQSNLKYSRLWTVNVADGKADQLTKQNFEIVEFAWSPAGNEFALVVAPTPKDEDSYNLSLVIINRSKGEVTRTLTNNVVPITGVLRWSPDGEWITFYEFPPTKESNNWLSLARAKGGEIRPLLKEYRGSVLKSEWAPDSKSLIALSVEGTSEVIARFSIDRGTPHKITTSCGRNGGQVLV